MTLAQLPPGAVFAGDLRIVRAVREGLVSAEYVVEQSGTVIARGLAVLDAAATPKTNQARYLEEARVAARLESERVLRVLRADVDPETRISYQLTEAVEGGTLGDYVHAHGALHPAQARALLEQAAEALGAAHALGIAHGDLSLEELVLGRADELKVRFGLVRAMKVAGTSATLPLEGQADYLAPECARGADATPASDVWALGLIAFRLLTARSYWMASNQPSVELAGVLQDVLEAPLVPASQRARELRARAVPAAFDAWFARCVHRDPDQRFHDAAEAGAALKKALDGAGIPLAPTAALEAPIAPAPLAPTAPAAPPTPVRRPGPGAGVLLFIAILLGLPVLVVAGLVGASLLFAPAPEPWDDDLPPLPAEPLPPDPLAEPAPPAWGMDRPPTQAPVDVSGPPAGAASSETGLAWRVIEPGTGLAHPGPRTRVRVHYTGWTTDGQQFDSSYERGRDATFGLHQVIPGWTEGLQLMVEGERRLLWIPEHLAYRGRPGAPAGMLVFDVRLLEILETPQPPPTPVDVGAVPPDAERTPSGLASRVLVPGAGTEHPGPRDRVTVHYTGWTTDGEMFDSSVSRGRPATFPLDRVIAGWTEGLQLMVAGEQRRLWIPADLAYGNSARGPQGMLVFDVELISFER